MLATSGGKLLGGVLLIIGIFLGIWLSRNAGFHVSFPVEITNSREFQQSSAAAPPVQGGTTQGAAPTQAPAPQAPAGGTGSSGLWGLAGPAPISLTGQPMYHPDGKTIIGWLVPGATHNIPAGVCIDYDHREDPGNWITGTYEEIFKSQTSRRVRLTSAGAYDGPYPVTLYWSRC